MRRAQAKHGSWENKGGKGETDGRLRSRLTSRQWTLQEGNQGKQKESRTRVAHLQASDCTKGKPRDTKRKSTRGRLTSRQWTLPWWSGMDVPWMMERTCCDSERTSKGSPRTPSGASSDCSRLGMSGVGMK